MFAKLLLLSFPISLPIQDPPLLVAGQTFEGTVTADAPVMHTRILDSAGYSGTPVPGAHLRIRVQSAGTYHVDLRSFYFDAYLVLRDAAGRQVAEDDDGLIGSHARLVVSLEEGVDYDLYACALHGQLGPFVASLTSGNPPVLSAADRSAADEAAKLEKLRYLEEREGPESLAVADAVRGLGWSYFNQGDYDRARHQYERCKSIAEAVDPSHYLVTSGLAMLQQIARAEGRFGDAYELGLEQLAILESRYGQGHVQTAPALGSLLLSACWVGRDDEGLDYGRRSVDIGTKFLAANNPSVLQYANNLAFHLSSRGHYEEARRYYEQVLSDGETVDPRNFYISLQNYAEVLMAQGGFQQALTAFQRVADNAGPGFPTHGVVSGMIGVCLEQLGRPAQALDAYRSGVAHRERELAPGHPNMAVAVGRLADALARQGEYEEADELLLRSLELSDTPDSLFFRHPLIKTLRSLGALRRLQGRPEEALPYLKRCLAVGGDASQSIKASYVRIDLADAYLDLGRIDDAYAVLIEDLDISAAHLGSELPTMSEGERLRAFATLASPNALLSCLVRMDEPPLDEALPRFVRWKGTVTRIQRLSRRLLQERGSPEHLSRVSDIQALDKKLSTLLFLPEEDQAKGHARQLTALRKERVKLERRLNRELGITDLMETPSPAKIQAAIPRDGVLLDFFVGSDTYVWVMKRKGAPVLLSLGETASLRAAHRAFLERTAFRGVRPRESAADPAHEYFQRLWGPLDELVGEAETVFVSPDGFLCELPFGTLQREGKYLLEEHRFAYLSDATQLVGCDGPSKNRVGSLLVVGDVDYYARDEAELVADASVRSRVGQTWSPLSGTREELESLRALHERVLRWDSPLVVLDQKAASEERVRQGLTGQRYVHIATHGYFEPDHLPSLMRNLDDPEQAIELEQQRIAAGMLPGLLSGLVLSGVNADPDPARDDGYLSAEEIGHLDLSECDLAVLSACETALGSERAGHGLMSLRRAFEVAGARTVVSSLWKVDDRATAALMRAFYEHYWKRELPKNEALHRAKLEALRQNRADFEGDARPATWGAFVLSGDWE